MLDHVQAQTAQIIEELLAEASLAPGDLFVVGCSTSEVLGEHIGKAGSLEVAAALFDGLYPSLAEKGIALAVQCCEHLNRALVIERAVALAHQLEIVSAMPYPDAGGSFAALAWTRFTDPVLVETIRAKAGLDIGQTMIGMHLAPVAVPLRLSLRTIGEAAILAAKTRPKLIGGARTRYE